LSGVVAASADGSARARVELIMAAALFSTGGAAIKSCSLTSFQVAGFRSLVAALSLVVLMRGARRGFGPRSALVAVAYATTLVLFVLANKLTTSANTIFLQSTAPLYVLLLGPWLLGERIRRSDLVFMATVATGLALFFVSSERPVQTAPDPLAGNLLALASGVSWAFTIVGLRWLSSGAHSGSAPAAAALGNVFAFAVCAPMAFPVIGARAEDWLLIGYLGIFQIGVAYVLVTRALTQMGALETSLLLLVEPVLNPIWAYVFHHEVPGAWALAGGALVLGATTVRAIRGGSSAGVVDG
jgi:drug/metabolite transporter, DME family